MAKIAFQDKQTLIDQPSIAEVNKMTAPNVNEIKASVNELYDYATYSNNEIRVGTWTDGKPLYRKVLVFPNGTGSTSVTAYTLSSYGITNVDNIFIVHPSYYTLSGKHYPFQYNDGTDFACNVSTTTLNITLGYAPISNSEFVITLEYTKTTD